MKLTNPSSSRTQSGSKPLEDTKPQDHPLEDRSLDKDPENVPPSSRSPEISGESDSEASLVARRLKPHFKAAIAFFLSFGVTAIVILFVHNRQFDDT